MKLGQKVTISFSYISPEPTGVRIFTRPMTRGAPAPSYAAHGSPLYPMGSGSAAGWFTTTGVGATVDEIRILMTNADQSRTLFNTKIPVSFQLM